MNKIKFIYFEDIPKDYRKYSYVINEAFEEIKKSYSHLNIEVEQLLPDYKDINSIMTNYLSCSLNKRDSFKQELEQNCLIDNEIIYFIDERWGDIPNAGSSFFINYLYRKEINNDANVIILTYYSVTDNFDGMLFLTKSDALTDIKNIKNRITSTALFKGILEKVSESQKVTFSDTDEGINYDKIT